MKDDEDYLQSGLTAYWAHHRAQQAAPLPGSLRALTGGWDSGVYTFAIPNTEVTGSPATLWVLKMYAPDERGREQATREWHALTRLRALNYPVPQGLLLETETSHLGRPFIVMAHIPSSSLWRSFEAADPVAQTELTRSFVTHLLALHALDPYVLDPVAVPTDPYGYIDQELEQLRRDSTNSSRTTLIEIVQWLEERKALVPCAQPVILQRDYHPWNVLVDATGQQWVIDWDWRIGDARFDLAWTCTLMQRSGFRAFSDAVRTAYSRQSDQSLEHFDYFEVLTTVRWLLNVLPSADSDTPLDGATREKFRAFLVAPIQEARTLLMSHTGIAVDIRM